MKKLLRQYLLFYYWLAKLCYYLLYLVAILFVFLSVALIVIFKNPFSDYSILAIKSDSMKPTMSRGSLIIMSKSENYKVDDVITFYPTSFLDGETFTHRIVEITTNQDDKTQYVTKGDNNENADQFEVLKNQVQGKMEYHIPYLGFLLLWLRSFEGLILFLVIPATILFTLNFQDLVNSIKEYYNKHIFENK